MSFSQALSGLRSQAENIKVISNNIANSQTVGFKGARASFADIFAGANPIGLGVRVAGISQDFRSGDLENTGRELDMAIAGQGFFRMEKTSGEVVYTRNGEFNQDANGFLVNTTGQFLTGYGLSNPNDPFSTVLPGGAPQRIQIPQDNLGPNATTLASAVYNLDSTVVPNANLQTANLVTSNASISPDVVAPINFHFSNSFTIYDSLGNNRTVTVYYEKTAGNLWGATVVLDGRKVGWGGNPSYDFEVNFTPDGVLDIAGTGAITAAAGDAGAPFGAGSNADGQVGLTFLAADYAPNGLANDLEFDIDLFGTTQFNSTSELNTLTQDGYRPGALIGIEVEDDGTIVRIFSNEERRDAGQVALTKFINPEGLMPDGDNAWRETNASGQPVIGVAGTGVFGTIESQTLENSNVDLAQELVDMIVSQRAYQANSSSIGTQDEMLQTIINL
ncbi:MAG: flagellar hook protein FlgE [Chromatiaceae bacterium]|nr:flagellar hook protein FlgE [Chromatiaceae bacterium]MCF7995731.1 flagellar hook protein FlgE [Chromatiaceae bacterium]MCF8014104.1 flagellar hook protein FlgE [Chromatiaceae bacterium]